jgi:hypothetical protein
VKEGTNPDLLSLSAFLPPPLGGDLAQLRVANGILTALVSPPAPPATGPAGTPAAGTPAAGTPAGKAPLATTAGAAAAPGGPVVPVIFGDASQLSAKVTALQTILAQVNLAAVTGIDLRVPDRPVLTGTPQPTNVSSTAGG